MHKPVVIFLMMGLTSATGCIAEPPGASSMPCRDGEAGPGDLQIQVYADAQHMEISDWDAATEKEGTITPFLDNGTDRYVVDDERLPSLTGPLDEKDCILFRNIEPGWWEIRAAARAGDADCAWYGGDGMMAFVEREDANTARFQITLACA